MKRIITCSDGTWNKPNLKENGVIIKTNVQKMFDCIEKRDPRNNTAQLKYYDEGIGAQGSMLTRILNGATGKGIDDNIKDIYKFICWNYEPGDEIYLFGFSRGAYTARSLAGLIRKCGILKKSDLNLIEEAYKLYRNTNTSPSKDAAKQFRKENCYINDDGEVYPLKFIGVWDTVGALGIPLNIFQFYNRRKYSFYDTRLSPIVEHAYHALAIDERRSTFEPCIWKRCDDSPACAKQVLEQRWFAGVHSNVGGGYADTTLSDIALKWLFNKADNIGLHMDPRYKALPDVYDGKLENSRTGIYKFQPSKIREIIADNKETFIDESVYKRMEIMGDKYQPPNVPPKK